MENVVSFKCPRHACFNCFEFHGILDGADLNGCLACPRSFHTNCILPGSRFNSMCVLCPLHPDAPLPSHDVRLNPKVAGAKKLAPSNEYSAFWDMLAIPEENPDPADPFANHFKLQTHVKDAAEDVPQTFTKITRNDYDTFPEGEKLNFRRCLVCHDMHFRIGIYFCVVSMSELARLSDSTINSLVDAVKYLQASSCKASSRRSPASARWTAATTA